MDKKAADNPGTAEKAENTEENSAKTDPDTEVNKPAHSAVSKETAETEEEKAKKISSLISELKQKNEITVAEGTLIERSKLPKPAKSDYPDCRYTAHFTGHAIRSGKPCPREICLTIEGFANYSLLKSNSVHGGDKVICTIAPFDLLPKDLQSTQLADDLDLFLLDNYYVFDIKKIGDFTDNGLTPSSGIFFSGSKISYVSIFDQKINPPVSDALREAQTEMIRSDLKKMDELLARFDDSAINEINRKFAEFWKKEKEKDPPNYNRVEVDNVTYVWRNTDNSFWALPENYTFMQKPDLLSQKTMNGLLSLKKACEANGVQFMICLVPDLHVMSSRVIDKDLQEIPDIQTATYVRQLSSIGIETVYTSDAIIHDYNRYPFAFFYPENGHPSDTAQDIISDILAERLQRYNFPERLTSSLFSEVAPKNRKYNSRQHPFPDNCDTYSDMPSWPTRGIVYEDAVPSGDKTAPVMIVGNSYMQFPSMSNKYSAIPSLISMKTLSPAGWFKMYGTGPLLDFPKRLLADPLFFLSQKKVLIIYIGTAHLSRVNQNDTMSDVSEIDRSRLLLNNRQCIMTFSSFASSRSKEEVIEKVKGEAFKTNTDLNVTFLNLPDSIFFVIGDKGKTVIDDIRLDQNPLFDSSKPLILVIPSCCDRDTSCDLTVNGKKMQIPSFFFPAQFNFLVIELPAGTNVIRISAEGKPDTVFAIKNIQIWQ